jgi:hypothetical protein
LFLPIKTNGGEIRKTAVRFFKKVYFLSSSMNPASYEFFKLRLFFDCHFGVGWWWVPSVSQEMIMGQGYVKRDTEEP